MTNDSALPENPRSVPREMLVATAIELAERGWVPDPLLRAGIRRFVRERLDLQRQSPCTPAALAAQLKTMPIAVETAAANRQHYEVPPAFFERVLGPRLKYSCAFWPEATQSLADAEEAMLELTLERAEIEDGMEVLDLGCGWGSLSLWLAERQPHTRITAVSNSVLQGRYIAARAAERGHGNVKVMTADVNRMLMPASFDRVVSVEMFEHVRNYQSLLGRIRRWLEPGGKLFVHIFCHREHGYLYEPAGAADWMARHFFSGGTMPSANLFSQFQDDMAVERSWWLGGLHYARTAEAWLAQLDAAHEELTALLDVTGPHGQGARSLQRWRIFFLACAELFGYAGGDEWGVGHYRFVRD